MYCKTVIVSLFSLLISRLNKPHSFNLFSKPLIILFAPPLAAFQDICMGFLLCSAPKWTQVQYCNVQ